MGKIMRNGVQYGVDTADVLSTVAECDASASGGKGTTQVASAKALSELNSNLGGIRFGVDEEGNWGYIKAGADTVTPFKKGATIGSVSASTSARLGPGNTTSLSINFSIPSNARLIGITSFSTSDDAFNICQINSPSNVSVRNTRNSVVTANFYFTAKYIIEE